MYYYNVDLDYAAAAGSESKEERVQLEQEALDASALYQGGDERAIKDKFTGNRGVPG